MRAWLPAPGLRWRPACCSAARRLRRARAAPLPVLVARRLCGRATARELGLDGQVALFARVLFACAMGAARAVDGVLRLLAPGVSIARLVMRLIGRTRLAPRDWDLDPQAPRWIKAIEGRFRSARAGNAGREVAA